MNIGNHRHATSRWIKCKIIGRIKDNVQYSPSDIVKDMLREHGAEVSYSKAWKAREMAVTEVYGCYKEAYKNMGHFLQKLKETNPGTICFIKTSPDGSFERVFIFFKACIDGFLNGCKPIVGIDGTHLTGKYPGILLGATGIDPNNGIFPLAYAVVEAEDQYTWTWFFECFRRSLPYFDPSIVFISDRQKGLIKATPNNDFCVFSTTCMYEWDG
ncbi:hypothetical protein ACHQM5_026259 [Ranunculus cassubicifolius]